MVSLQKKEAERPKVEVVEEEEEVVVHEDNDWGEEELQVNPDYSHQSMVRNVQCSHDTCVCV